MMDAITYGAGYVGSLEEDEREREEHTFIKCTRQETIQFARHDEVGG